MRIPAIGIFCLSAILSCGKKDIKEDLTPPAPITLADSLYQVTAAVKIDVNEFDIRYKVVPPTNETYSNVYLIWSTSGDFSVDKDSIIISNIPVQSGNKLLTGLQQAKTYYGKIGLTYKSKRFYSGVKSWSTDTLKIITAGYFGLRRGMNKGDTVIAVTNLLPMMANQFSQTKIYLGPYECPLVSDQGLTISFSVPSSIPINKYILKIKTRGMEVQANDSTEVLRGDWSFVTSPVIPGNPYAQASGLMFFNGCYSNQKGYIIGGVYFNGPQVPWPGSMYPEYILEYDGQQNTWTKRYPPNPRYFENPICYYYNNSIYVLGGTQWVVDLVNPNTTGVILKKMYRLDLANFTWHEMDPLPYPTIFNLTSFELNNEWYIGMGADSANRTICCGDPIPSKKFWKYTPATNQWTQLTDFPGSHQNFPTGFSIGSKGYFFYGAIPIGNPNIALDFDQEFWEYNPATNSWASIPIPSTIAPPPGEKYQIVTSNNKAYFLSCQKRTLSGLGYGFTGFIPCLEWDPLDNTYHYVAFPYGGDIFKTVYRNGNKFIFQSDALGYFESIPNRTYSFIVE